MKSMPIIPKSILARILRELYSDKSIPASGITYYELLRRLLMYGSVIMCDFNEALKCTRFIRWDLENDKIYPEG
jgi:hypothetical protein